ncbi:hypothetical protein PYK79_08460 [Streptomyces sp. ID05-04B]|nr:hypothetical protein [Streptomyces sp. ID05-04B]
MFAPDDTSKGTAVNPITQHARKGVAGPVGATRIVAQLEIVL